MSGFGAVPTMGMRKPGDPQPFHGLSKARLFAAKGLDAAKLRPWLIEDWADWMGRQSVSWPVCDKQGKVLFYRSRLRLHKQDAKDTGRFHQPAGTPVMPFGLQYLRFLPASAWVLLVEGETDVWSLYQHDIVAFGVPGTNCYKPEWAALFAGRPVYLWREPDDAAGALETRVVKAHPGALVIEAPGGLKDPNDAHVKGLLSREWLTALAEQARPGKVGDLSARGYGPTGEGYDLSGLLDERSRPRRRVVTLAPSLARQRGVSVLVPKAVRR